MPKDWRGNVRYLLKQLFRWRLNCTEIAQASDRRAVFPTPDQERKPTANLLNEALPRAVKDCAFLRFSASAFPIYALSKRVPSQRCFHSRNQLSKKAKEDVSPLRAPRMSCWDHFVILSLLLLNLRGFSSKQQGLHLKRPTYFFSAPSTWRHAISPNFFYKPNTARKPKTYTYKFPYRNDKNSVLPFTKAIMLPGQAILPHRWAGFPSQPTPISEGIESWGAIANTAYAFSSRYKRKRWTTFSRCAKRRITPAYFSLFPHYFSRKVVHFPAKVVLFFQPLLAPLSFPPGLPNEMAHFPTLSHSFQQPAQALFPFDHHLPTRTLDFPRPFHLLHKTKQQQLIRR